MPKWKQKLFELKWKRYHPDAFSRFAHLLESERLPADQLRERQEEARRKIVRHAMEHTAFYRQHYAASGFEVGDIGTDGWFEKLPPVTKAHLRSHFEEMTDLSQKQFLRLSTTGGSTGTPTKTGFDGRLPEEIYNWRILNWFGVHPGEDRGSLWRATRTTWRQKFVNRALWWPTRHLQLDASFMTESSLRAFLKQFNRLRPACLQGYVGAISQLARFVIDNQIEAWSPKFVWVTSAPLSPVQRKLIADAFHAPVCDQYGSCEIRWIAQQCPEGKGLHVNVEHVHLEYVDEENHPVPAGVYGRTLLTNLEDMVFPLIRYENGDRGRWLLESCPCGRSLPLIDTVKGRESESFVLPSGKTINGEYLTTIFDATPDLARGFRVIQHRDLSITVEYIPSSDQDVPRIESVIRAFSAKIGGEVPVESRVVHESAHDRGKLRFVVRER